MADSSVKLSTIPVLDRALVRLRPGTEILRTGPQEFLLRGPDGSLLNCGAAERHLLHLLQNLESIDEVLRAHEHRFGPGLQRQQVEAFLEQLRVLGLIAGADGASAEPNTAPFNPPPAPKPTSLADPPPAPLSRQDPRAGLNFFFDLLVVGFGWILHPIFTVPVLMATFLAVTIVVNHWQRCLIDLNAPRVLFPILPLIAIEMAQTLLLVNLPRTLLQGMTSRRFGGRILGFGFRLEHGLIPNFYCERDDTAVFMNDRGRKTLLWIDLWSRMAVGSLGIFLWSLARPGSLAAMFWIWTVPPCLLSIVYHLLFFFENSCTYWALCDHLKQQRLRERALAETVAWLTFRPAPEALTADERYWFRVYGLGLIGFRIVLDSLLIIVIGTWLVRLYQGKGALVALGLLLWYYNRPLGRLFMENAAMRWLIRCGGHWWFRWSARLLLLAGIISLGMIPYNHEIVGECRLVSTTQYGVRVRLDSGTATDEIAEVHVSEGDFVEPGDLIVTLAGRTARANVRMSEAALEEAEAELELLLNGPREEDISIATATVDLRKNQLDYQESRYARIEALNTKKMASQAELEKARSDRDDARINLLSARQELSKLTAGYRPEQIQAQLAKVKRLREKLIHDQEVLANTRVTTPFRGVVCTPYMEERKGQGVHDGDLVAIIQESSPLRAEMAADDAAAIYVKPGMPVKIRLFGTYGHLITGKVHSIAPAIEPMSRFGNNPVRTDKEMYQEQAANSRHHSRYYQLRIYLDLDDYPPGLTTENTGYARIVVGEDVLWRALARPIVRFLLTEVWSWLP